MVLEVGCGTGNVLRVLEKACRRGTVVGMELWFEGLTVAKARTRALLVQGDVREFPFRKRFDMVGVFDVLEHIAQESETLIALRGSLVPGGRLLITVPAHQSLWSYFDEASHHCRRYSTNSLREKITSAGFEVEFLSEFMTSIFPLVWLVRKAGLGGGKGGIPAGARALADKESPFDPSVERNVGGAAYPGSALVERGAQTALRHFNYRHRQEALADSRWRGQIRAPGQDAIPEGPGARLMRRSDKSYRRSRPCTIPKPLRWRRFARVGPVRHRRSDPSRR